MKIWHKNLKCWMNPTREDCEWAADCWALLGFPYTDEEYAFWESYIPTLVDLMRAGF